MSQKPVSTIMLVVSLLSSSFLCLVGNASATDYTFGTETVTKGYSVNPTGKDAEDGTFNSLVEGDQYADTNYSGSSETVTIGTAGGGAFSASLDTDDATRRSYTEVNVNPADTTKYLVPTSDISVGFDATYPTSPTDHYSKIDDGTSHDSDTTYNTAVTNADRDVYGVTDLSGIVGTPAFDVTVHYWAMRAATGTSSMDVGLRIGSTDYVGIDGVSAGADYAELTYTWNIDPSTSAEWTEAGINAITIYMQCDDAAPDVKVTSCYLAVSVDYAVLYQLDAQVTYSSVPTSSQTISFNVICQGYRSGSEDFGVYAWDYIASTWGLKATVNAASDTNFNFALASNERSTGSDEVKIRLVGLSESTDTTQDILYLDLLKVNRLEKGYAVDVSITSTSAPAYGNITLRIKGYTSSETFNVNVWNYTSAAYETGKVVITSGGNAWQTTFDLHDTHHRSGTSVKVQFTDGTAASADTVQDTLFVDVAWITLEYSNPTVTSFGGVPVDVLEGESIYFWLTYTDYDNQAPSYVYLHIDGSNIAMTANNSGDLAYHDGKQYYLTKSDLAIGDYEYYFTVKDATSGDISSTPAEVCVCAPANAAPEFTSTPAATGHNNTVYYYDANADDADLDVLTFDLEGSITAWATIAPATGIAQGTPTVIGDYWMNISVTDGIATVWQNTSVHIYTDAPSFITSAITTWQNGTTYSYNAQATDPEAEGLSFHITGNGTSFIGIVPAGYYCMVSGPITSMGWWYLNLSVTDGTNSVDQDWILTALNQAPYFTSTPILEGMVNVSYSYVPVAADNNSDTLIYSLDESPIETLGWLSLNLTTGALEGTPTVNGSYAVTLSVTDGLLTTYQNFTITVDLNNADTVSVLALVIGLVFCFGFLVLGFREKLLWLLAGPVWIICGISIFYDYGGAFMIASVGLGIAVFVMGAKDALR